jgi:hypothetical protein
MYEYKFVELSLTWTATLKLSYHDVVRQHAKEGWRLVQIVGPECLGRRTHPVAEAIFERPAKVPYASPA